MPISGLEPRLSGVGGNHSANCATTDAFPVIPLLAFDHLISESCFKGISHWSHLCSNPLGPLSRKKDQIQHSNCANDFNHLLCPSIFLLFYNSILFYLSIFLLIYISIFFSVLLYFFSFWILPNFYSPLSDLHSFNLFFFAHIKPPKSLSFNYILQFSPS